MLNLSHASAIRKTLAVGFITVGLSSGLFAQNLVPAAPPAAVPQAAPKPSSKKLSDSLNAELPKWLSFSGEYRLRVEPIAGIGFKPSSSDAFVLNRIRLNTSIKPTSWMRFQLQGQDAQAMGRNAKPDAPPFEDTFDLTQAFVEFGSPESAKVAVRIGRQELFFGGQRLVGHLAWTNTARQFDAVRLTLRSKKARLDVFSSSVVKQYDGSFNRRLDGDNFHGAYAVLNVLPKKGTFEPYFFWRESGGVRAETGGNFKMNAETFGFRANGKMPANFDYTVETVGQAGSVGTDEVRAWAGYAVFGYSVAKSKLKPRLIVEYNYASGDNNATDGRRETFDQLYPTGHDKIGLNDQVGWKNVSAVRGGIELKPTTRLSLSSSVHSFWLADVHDSLYGANGASIVKVASGAAGRHIGQEADIQLGYAVTPLLQFTAGYGHLFPGQFLINATPGVANRFSYISAVYQF